ncbi:ABC transporter substrate-binding protein [Shouchella shacheensis]|uniref:ABC transporter substrate-binding protein n=1 Tax=Shouchella shacheensis TaxID=1649580 RepID=UPI0007403D00|nr:ABC transporter substrate-binding protein [Shouchella shacheensis]
MSSTKTYVVGLSVCMSLLTACAQGEAGSNETNQDSTKTMTDGVGNEVTIPEEPERIVAPYLEDPLVTIGEEPVRQWAVQNGSSHQQYLEEFLGDTEFIDYELPLEALMEAEPDLVIVPDVSSLGSGEYEQYSQIAPTYVLGTEASEDWRTALTEIGTILDREDAAEEALNEYDSYVEEVKEQLGEHVGSDKVAAIWVTNGSYYIVAPDVASGAVLFEDLGLHPANAIANLPDEVEAHWNELSLEALAELDADYLFLISSDEGSADDLTTESVWSNIPAVEKDQVIEISEDSSWLYNGYQANRQTIEEVYTELIEKE